MLVCDNVALARDGFVVVSARLDAGQVDHLLARLPAAGIHGMRNLLDDPFVRDCAAGTGMRALVEPILGPRARPVRALFFDKSATTNWKVPWHQDLSIAVRERHDVPGFGPGSVKHGVVHVQPPRDVLESMLTVRLHLDECGADNGPLRVIAGSHASGLLSATRIEAAARDGPQMTCIVPRGGALLMRPLVLHASSPAHRPTRRRVLHLEYASGDLPHGLRWHWN